MAITAAQQDEDTGQFADAFDNQPADKPMQTEEEAFGLSPEIAAGDVGTGSNPSVTTEAVEPVTEVAPEGEAPTEAIAQETPAAEMAEEVQEPAAEESAEIPNEEMADASGDDEVEAAKKALADDFGPEFVRLIEIIAVACAGKTAGDAIGETSKTVQEIIADLQGTKARVHFERIFDKHPEFMTIAESPEFLKWVSDQPPEAQEECKQIIESGSARQVIGMLDAFVKTKNAPAATADDEWADGAEGVRSTGMVLPETPATNDDYEAAWNKA